MDRSSSVPTVLSTMVNGGNIHIILQMSELDTTAGQGLAELLTYSDLFCLFLERRACTLSLLEKLVQSPGNKPGGGA